MRLEIVHSTRYRYSAPVYLEPHVLRFRPRSNSWQRLVSFSLDIAPLPVSLNETLDIEGNETAVAWFGVLTDQLELQARALVETPRTNPFDFLWIGNSGLPVRYDAHTEAVLEPYRRHASAPELHRYATEVARAAGGDAQAFLRQLTSTLHVAYHHIERLDGDPWTPEETLQRSEASCRDLGVLYVALCRELGFAARFVSGYCAVEEAGVHDLHAWAEVYVPGGGWRGFDPSTGLAVTDRHVAVAAGAFSEDAAPVTGMFRGSATALPIETELRIRLLD